MLAQALGVSCSSRCELLMALTACKNPHEILPIAHTIANDSQLSAITLAKALDKLPNEQKKLLGLETLRAYGIKLNEEEVG